MTQELVTNTLLFVGIALGPLSLVVLTLWFAVAALRGLYRQFIQTRQIQLTPCYRCVYFSGSEELRCAVNPCEALTRSARDCQDFTPSQSPKQVTFWYHKL
ncbi:hypothetical protein PN498_25195 [Oscillatoria sp. CS-180]|uniref:hypothetical protein n=1 Tax=Oscillatoria sp. CS-180 TaxID=3021720 RepID=UPI00232B2C30|nr:hypothetical protein [Oscillatoria sp. CS-180]MDB9529313.1 hypothetical protein [Oscillatoria sp. CS-180]